MRFLFASLVILSHSWALGLGAEGHEPLARWTGDQITFGSLAVYSFFIISGFLITHSWCNKPQIGNFLMKRVARIYPGFIVAAIISVFVVAPLFSADGYSGIKASYFPRLLGDLVRLKCSSPVEAFAENPYPHAINGSLWSIPYEFRCYIGVIMLAAGGLIAGRRWLAFLFAASIVASVVYSFYPIPPEFGVVKGVLGSPKEWIRLLPYFLSGMVFYVYLDRLKLTNMGAGIALATLVVAALVPAGLAVALPLAFTYLILWFAFAEWIPLQRWGKYGDFSYGIYVYAFPAQQAIVYGFGGGAMNPWKLFLLAWPISIIMGALSWHLVEKRWLARSRRQSVREPAAGAVTGSTLTTPVAVVPAYRST